MANGLGNIAFAKEASAAADSAAAEKISYPLTITHQSGETVIESEPQKIVVLDMGTLDTIDAAGLGSKVVGTLVNSLLDEYKDSEGIDYSTLPNCGNPKEADMEAVAKLEPDLVFIGGRMSSSYEEFAKQWPTINGGVSWKEGGYSEKVAENAQMVATACGDAAKGAEFKKAIEDKIAEYTDLGKGKGKAMVLMTNGGEISMHGTSSRWAAIWDVFGFDTIEEAEQKSDEGHKGDKLTFETVAEINPDYIFVVDRDAAVGSTDTGTNAEQVLDNDFIASTTAAQNGNICYLSPARWYLLMYGANNYQVMLDEVADFIKK